MAIISSTTESNKASPLSFDKFSFNKKNDLGFINNLKVNLIEYGTKESTTLVEKIKYLLTSFLLAFNSKKDFKNKYKSISNIKFQVYEDNLFIEKKLEAAQVIAFLRLGISPKYLKEVAATANKDVTEFKENLIAKDKALKADILKKKKSVKIVDKSSTNKEPKQSSGLFKTLRSWFNLNIEDTDMTGAL